MRRALPVDGPWTGLHQPGPAKIRAWLDERPIIDQIITDRRVDTRAEVEPSEPLGVAAWRTKSAVRNIRLRRL